MKGMQRLYQRLLPHAGILFIVILAFVLRIIHGNQIPLTNDELSALHRLHFSSFTDFINGGVKPDGHPALVQVFLYYYVTLFGDGAFILKLPFMLCGVAAIAVAYRVFLFLLNKPTALAVGAIMGCSQFFVMHAQTARPYAPALLFTLLFTQALLTNEKKHAWLLCGVWLALAASTHYLAALTALVVLLAAWCCRLITFRKSLLTGLFALMLYLPQLPVFMVQLKTGGVGTWLGPPEKTFTTQFMAYAFQYNILTYWLAFISAWAVIIAMLSGGVSTFTQRALLFCAMVFFVTLGVAWGYSVWRNPVLQFPVLLFSWPFMLGFIWYGLERFRPLWFILLLVQYYALTSQRKHYTVFYQQGYKQCMESLLTFPLQGATVLLNGNQPEYFSYYQGKHQHNIQHTRIDSLSLTTFDSLVRQINMDTLVVAHAFYLSPEYWQIARWHFPHQFRLAQHAFNETQVFIRDKRSNQVPLPLHELDSAALYGMDTTCYQTLDAGKTLRVYAWVQTTDTCAELVLKVFNQKGQTMYEEGTRTRVGNCLLLCTELKPSPVAQELSVVAFLVNNYRKKIRVSRPVIRMESGNALLFGTVLPVP